MKDKAIVLDAIQTYSEGGTVQAAMKAHGLNPTRFYAVIYGDSDVEALYLQIQKARADMLVDDCLDISTDSEIDSKRARVQAEIKMKVAGFFNRARFGQQIDLTLDQRISIAAPLAAAKARLRPLRDLGQVTDAEVVELPRLSDQRASDKQSEAQVSTPRKLQVNPFD